MSYRLFSYETPINGVNSNGYGELHEHNVKSLCDRVVQDGTGETKVS